MKYDKMMKMTKHLEEQNYYVNTDDKWKELDEYLARNRYTE